MRRAAVSISANIAEGQGRLTRGEWAHFLGIARGSLYELENHIEVAKELGYLTVEAEILQFEIRSVARVLDGLIRFVRPTRKH